MRKLIPLLLLAVPLAHADAKRGELGKLPDGTRIESVQLTNARGMSARIIVE